jgi:hypothetical protein
MNTDVKTNTIDGASGFNGRHRRKLQQRRGQIDHLVAGIGQDAVTDPAQNQQHGTEEIEAETQ